MAIKGYVVRFLDGETACEVTPDSLTSAVRAVRELPAYDALDFRVHPDGREERLPSYEETLAGLQTVSDVLAVFGVPDDGTGLPQRLQSLHEGAHADPLAALEAAERRLLEAGGWIEVEAERWQWPGQRRPNAARWR